LRIVRPASESEVVAAFLRGELESPRWGDGLRALLAEDGLDASVLDDPGEDAYRAELLDRHRGWLRRRGLFEGLPERIEWTRAALSPAEVLAIRFIRWDWWLEISGGTRSPVEAAARIRRGEIPGVTAEEHEPIAARLRSPPSPADLIAVGPPSREPLVLLEGHVRLTAYALYPEYLPAELELYVGTAPDIDRWSEF
jgi:hypothetical protein